MFQHKQLCSFAIPLANVMATPDYANYPPPPHLTPIYLLIPPLQNERILVYSFDTSAL